jgi:hypothetical protein
MPQSFHPQWTPREKALKHERFGDMNRSADPGLVGQHQR